LNASTGNLQPVLLIHPEFGPEDGPESRQEFHHLAVSAGLEVVAEIRAPRNRPDSRWLVGSGKVDEARELVERHELKLVLVNHPLSPVQERNLARSLCCSVLDRTSLILDIFAQRARSHEGKLQVELAQLRHLSTRLVRGWTHLERQRGGIGMRGPGETQLETDRRLLGGRIRMLKTRLEKVERRRKQGRRARSRSGYPLIALVGYTNAGKSTLFNRLTESEVLARDQLFATLDPTVRRMQDVDGAPVLASDTVGFIRNLPHELIAAFRATLEETLSASLIIHVVDASDADRDRHAGVVDEVLEEIGAGEMPRLMVYNKVDLAEIAPRIEHDESGRPRCVYLSATSGEGVDLFLQAVDERLGENRIERCIRVPAAHARLRARLFDLGVVREESPEPDGSSNLEVAIDRKEARQLARMEGADGRLARQLLLN